MVSRWLREGAGRHITETIENHGLAALRELEVRFVHPVQAQREPTPSGVTTRSFRHGVFLRDCDFTVI